MEVDEEDSGSSHLLGLRCGTILGSARPPSRPGISPHTLPWPEGCCWSPSLGLADQGGHRGRKQQPKPGGDGRQPEPALPGRSSAPEEKESADVSSLEPGLFNPPAMLSQHKHADLDPVAPRRSRESGDDLPRGGSHPADRQAVRSGCLQL